MFRNLCVFLSDVLMDQSLLLFLFFSSSSSSTSPVLTAFSFLVFITEVFLSCVCVGRYPFYQRHAVKEACKFLVRTALPRVKTKPSSSPSSFSCSSLFLLFFLSSSAFSFLFSPQFLCLWLLWKNRRLEVFNLTQMSSLIFFFLSFSSFLFLSSSFSLRKQSPFYLPWICRTLIWGDLGDTYSSFRCIDSWRV